MKIQNIQPAAFGRKQRFITKKMYGDMRTILTDMNKEASTTDNGFIFLCTRTKSLKCKDAAEFIDGRMFFQKMPEDKQMQKKSVIRIGTTQLVIDNSTGKIVKYKKPDSTTWESVMDLLGKYLNIFKDNFDNKDVVKKEYSFYSDLTQKGSEVLMPYSTETKRIMTKI